LESDTSLIDIDLLRSGERLLPNADLKAYLLSLEPQPAYLVLVNRAWRRSGVEMAYQLFAMSLREDEVSLDLQWLFNQAYDRDPYRRGAVDYQREPEPPLGPDDTEWLAQRLRDQQLRS
jgi:hypothetical protein